MKRAREREERFSGALGGALQTSGDRRLVPEGHRDWFSGTVPLSSPQKVFAQCECGFRIEFGREAFLGERWPFDEPAAKHLEEVTAALHLTTQDGGPNGKEDAGADGGVPLEGAGIVGGAE